MMPLMGSLKTALAVGGQGTLARPILAPIMKSMGRHSSSVTQSLTMVFTSSETSRKK